MARLRNEVFFSFDELNEAIAQAIDDINEKPFQVREGSRRIQFENEERELLKALPAKHYETSVWKRAKVSPDYHIESKAFDFTWNGKPGEMQSYMA